MFACSMADADAKRLRAGSTAVSRGAAIDVEDDVAFWEGMMVAIRGEQFVAMAGRYGSAVTAGRNDKNDRV